LNNAQCDEPGGGGTNLCAPGSDSIDCNCVGLQNNDTCDEPGGGGTDTCAPGTDSIDCFCATENDGNCDEPEGNNTCAEGTDTDDCA
jgi:hypothetical protein